MRVTARTASTAALLLWLAGMARADEVRVVSVGAVQNAVRALMADFTADSGHQIKLTIGSPAAVMQKLKEGEIFDAIIVSEPAMDQLDREGIVNPESRTPLAATGLGVAVRSDVRAPDVSTPEAFKQTLGAAKSIVYGDPAPPNQSGEKTERVLANAGVLEALRPKIRIVPGQVQRQEMIAKGEIELGFYNISEIPEGLQLAGPVPPPLQINTTYEAALLSDGSAVEAARAFIEFLARPEAGARWHAARLEPAH